MLPYSAVDIVSLVAANFSDEPVRRPHSLRTRIIAFVALMEVAALWVGAGAFTSLT